MTDAISELRRTVHAALETYSNVHRGSGHHSVVSTRLFDHTRDVVLAHLGLASDGHVVVFCTPRRAELLEAQLPPGACQEVSSRDVGLALGARALAIRRQALRRATPAETGGGTARLVAPGWVVRARVPERFEAGTPAIVNVVALARALQLVQRDAVDALRATNVPQRTAADILCRDTLEPRSGRELLHALRETLIGGRGTVPTAEGARRYVNLDNAASTPTFEAVWEAAWQACWQPRTVQQAIVDEVRSICAGVLGAPPADYDLVFTSNATEAINLVAESLRGEARDDGEPVVLNTLLEHNSNELPWRTIAGSPVRLSVDREGFVDTDELESRLRAYNEAGRHGRRRIRLVAVSGASNVLGTINDLAPIAQLAHRYGARLLVDAAQLVAHRRVDMAACGIDALVFSAHKVYAPFGSGVLAVRKGSLGFSPAETELVRSSGEENVVGIAALGKALVLLQRIGMDVIEEEERGLTARALRGLARLPGVTVYGVKDPDSPRFARRSGVIAFSMKRLFPDRLARALAARGIGVRYGCHCAHLLVKRLLHVPLPLEQVQRLIVTLFPRFELPGVVRASLGLENTEADVDALVEALAAIARDHGSRPKEVDQRIEASAREAAERVFAPLHTT